MRNKLSRFNNQIVRLVRSPRFFYALVALLTVQALWIALTARFPQAFDENYHLGLIKLHADQLWTPFFRTQPPGGAAYGPLISDPSYLFHYLMALPYLLLQQLTANETIQIVGLRLLNISLFVWGLFVYRKLFDELKISVAIRNIALLIFVLLPVVPLLAAHINYDNMLVPLTGLLFLYLTRYIHFMRRRRPGGPLIAIRPLLQVLLIGGVASITKFAFAPIFFAAITALIVATLFYYHHMRIRPSGVRSLFEAQTSRLRLVILAISTVVVLGLCFERYGLNLIEYGSPVPKCDKVLSIDECLSYSPWARDHEYAQTYPRPTWQGYAVYPFVWIWRMVYETMFTITSRTYQGWQNVFYYAYSPLPIAFITAFIGLVGGLTGLLRHWHVIRLNRALSVLLSIVVFYCLVLFWQNLNMYRHSGEAVAIHGRYLIPVYPILLVCLAIGWHELLKRIRHSRYETVVLVALTLLFLQGGGSTVWLVRSSPAWYWPDIPAAADANAALKTLTDRVIYHP